MRIGILGAGNVGKALGAGWARSGHEITFGLRNPDDAKYAGLKDDPGARLATVADAAREADIVVLATPWPATESAIADAGDLSGKIVVDCTNPLNADFTGLTHGHDDSGGEQVARWATGAKVVKAFNTTGSANMTNPVIGQHRSVMFVSGDDEGARRQVAELSDQLGFETIEAGPLSTSRYLEPFAMLWIACRYQFGMTGDFAFTIARP